MSLSCSYRHTKKDQDLHEAEDQAIAPEPTMATTLRSYSAYWGQPVGSSGSGLDQTMGWIARDPGLAGNTEASAIAAGLQAANGLNQLIITGLREIDSLNDVVLDSDDIRRLNTWLRSDTARQSTFQVFHGDDENGVTTGFHNIQNDGANEKFRGLNLVDTVLDGIYHFGFEINANNQFLNEDGDANAAIADVASWLTALKTDLATTNTSLDRTTELIIADRGLGGRISWADIAGGATAADNLNGLILQGIAAMGASGQADGDATRLSSNEVRWINQWIRADQTRYNFLSATMATMRMALKQGFTWYKMTEPIQPSLAKISSTPCSMGSTISASESLLIIDLRTKMAMPTPHQ